MLDGMSSVHIDSAASSVTNPCLGDGVLLALPGLSDPERAIFAVCVGRWSVVKFGLEV